MPNMNQIISKHNKSITKSKPNNPVQKDCNCRRGTTCPLNGKCQQKGVIYQATVTRNDDNKKDTYIGLTDNTFKTRYNGHTHSFRNENKRNATTLSQHIWNLKDNSINYSITWKIVSKGKSYSPSSKTCNLCLKEKYFIICKPEMATLNNRNELATGCRHKAKYLLCNL